MNKKLTIKTSGKETKNSQKKTAGTKPSDNEMLSPEEWSLIAIESAPYGVLVHDPDGNILIFNSQLEIISGYGKDEIPDVATWIKKVYPDNDYRKLVLEQRGSKIQTDRRVSEMPSSPAKTEKNASVNSHPSCRLRAFEQFLLKIQVC